MALNEYRKKRDCRVSPEPTGKASRKQGWSFVVQKHDASRLHYDFRLELDGVLLSWAVPKGPSMDPAVKRLAVHVEDHPVEYGSFEGTIPEGEYGAGTVMLWDRGKWEPDDDPRAGYQQGRLRFTIHGKRLHGGWILTRTGGRAGGDGRNWLLIKRRDAHVSTADITTKFTRSIKSDRTMEEIAAGKSKRRTKSTAVRDEVAHIAGVRLTHPNKVLYSQQGITKADLANYYLAVAKWMLPHVAHRPLAIVRCPHGEGKTCFFQKHPDAGTPKNLRQVPIQEKEKRATYVVVEKPDDLVALVQVGALEIHAWGSKIDKLEQPDRLTFDLDPDPNVPWKQVVAAAGQVRDFLVELGLKSFVKTTGGKGLHLVVPIQRRQTWPDVKKFCRAVADAVVEADPRRYTANMAKAARTGKIFIDYLRNDRGATAIVPYSTRARPQAPISVPLAWDELDPQITSDHFHLAEVVGRLSRLRKDPWHELPRIRQTLTRAAHDLLGAAARKEK